MPDLIHIETTAAVAVLDAATGALVSFRSKAAPEQEFIADANAPAFVIQYLDPHPGPDSDGFRQVDSRQARHTEVKLRSAQSVVVAHYQRLGGMDLDAAVTVRAEPNDPFLRWSISVRNGAGIIISDVQFPFVVCPFQLGAAAGTEELVWPFGPGARYHCPRPEQLPLDVPETWQMRPENGDAYHYPGYTVAQFQAYYNHRAGLYLSCEDNSGRVKLIRPVNRDGNLRLGVAHCGDWAQGEWCDLGYDVVLGTFTGDWYTAAELYKEWALRQPWAQPLHARKDVPDWLLDSPPHIIVRIQGEVDDGPAEPNEEFLPYRKIVPLLDALAARVEAPLVAVIMSWERGGPWVYPECFPPVGGYGSLREFCDLMRERGWHVGSFCNGTRWVVGHRWSGYDGREYFEHNGGEGCACRTATGELWVEGWDSSWRPSYPCCLGVQQTFQTAVDFVNTLRELGLDWVQFLDQNVGCCTFPCYARDHGHPPVPGRWMTERMAALTGAFLEMAAQEEATSGRRMAFSVECPVNEVFIPRHQICDVRVIPAGHKAFGGDTFIPLYHFLYHELILIQGGFGTGPEPYHMPIRNAYNLVVGEIPGGVLKGNGELLNVDTMNWGPWDVEVGNNDDSVAMLRTTTALRRGAGRPYLVFGRMLRPALVGGIPDMEWEHNGQHHSIPAVFHAAWQSPEGKTAVVLANWTTEPREVQVWDKRLGPIARVVISGENTEELRREAGDHGFEVTIPALGCALVEEAQ